MTAACERLSVFPVVLFDIGGTLVEEAAPGTATSELVARPRHGALALLRCLAAQVRVGAVTNTAVMGAEEVRRLLVPCGLAAHLEHIVTSAEVGAHKPDPAPLLAACELFGVDPGGAAYVGNVDTDRQAAQACGMAYVDVAELWSPSPSSQATAS